MYYFSLYLGSGVGEGGKKGKVKENGTEGWNRVTDFERLVYNNRLSKGLADRRRLERLKASHPNLYYCSNERSIGADRPLYPMRRYLFVLLPFHPLFLHRLSANFSDFE